MEKLIEILNSVSLYFIAGFIAIFVTLENIWPWFKNRKHKARHFFGNFGLLLINFLFNFAIGFIVAGWVVYVEEHKLGLLNLLGISAVWKAWIGVAAADFSSYVYHRLAHRIPLYWRAHRVHHSDTDMDASTAFRFHPLEAIASIPVQVIIVGLMGYGFSSIVLYGTIMTPVFLLQHANLKYPAWIDKTFGMIFSTPNIHRVHHSDDRQYTDSNYGDMFCIWDKLFGTFKKADTETLSYGLKEFADEKKQSFWYAVTTPFRK